MKRPAFALALLFLFLLLTRLCHTGIVWVEEAYPAAAAIQMLGGKAMYHDFWFDKPPLTPLLYLLWGAHTGVPLRLAGTIFLFSCCALAYVFARDLWSAREGVVAASLLAFFVTFDMPSAVMALAPDLVMLLPHLGAVYLASRRRAFASGLVAGAAMLVNPKGAFVLAACFLWCWREWLPLITGFATINGIALATLAATDSLNPYYVQVWRWGALYSQDTFVDRPLAEGLRRTAAWMGFHGAVVVAAAWYWGRERTPYAKRFALWTVLALVGIALGWRFFPRYYFLLLPAVVLAASRGFTLAPLRVQMGFCLLLLIPMVRFGPRYVTLAMGSERAWADVAMNRDSRDASDALLRIRRAGDTLLVWGYRPDIFMYTRMPAGTPFLDSQPLTGVIADRHLTTSDVSAPELAKRNRRELTSFHPSFIVDGLSLYNPRLAITGYPDLANWLLQYEEVTRTAQSILYRLRPAAAPPN